MDFVRGESNNDFFLYKLCLSRLHFNVRHLKKIKNTSRLIYVFKLTFTQNQQPKALLIARLLPKLHDLKKKSDLNTENINNKIHIHSSKRIKTTKVNEGVNVVMTLLFDTTNP